MTFQIGDRVMIVNARNVDPYEEGELGTVVSVPDNGDDGSCNIGVRFDRESERAHTCWDLCDNGHGWWCFANALKLIDDEPDPEAIASDDQLLQMLYGEETDNER